MSFYECYVHEAELFDCITGGGADSQSWGRLGEGINFWIVPTTCLRSQYVITSLNTNLCSQTGIQLFVKLFKLTFKNCVCVCAFKPGIKTQSIL